MASPLFFDFSLHLQPVSISILFSVLLSALLLFCFHLNRSSSQKPRLPPSPPKLPFIGNLHQLGSPPHNFLRALSEKYGPLMLLQLGQVPTLVVSSPEMAEEVLKTHDLAFASRPRIRASAALTGGRGLGSAPYGEYWRQARRITAVHLLSANRVQAFRPAREEEVGRLVGRVSELSSSGDAINMSRMLSGFTNSLICRAAVGRSAMEGREAEGITQLVAQTVALLTGFQLQDFFPTLTWLSKLTGMEAELSEVVGRWRAIIHRVVEAAERRREEREGDAGLLDVLLSLQREPASTGTFIPSRDEIEAILLSMISAGTDTSYIVLEGALEDLVKNPRVLKKAQDEVRGVAQGKSTVEEDDVCQMVYLKAVIKEALRLHPPAPLLIPRESMKTVQIEGYEIPAKTRVVVNAWAIARDPDYWESPEEFQPERFLSSSVDYKGNDFQFISFGAGRRICPGMHFATATMELALANLLYHFDWSLPDGENGGGDVDKVDEALSLTTRKRRSLLLVAKPNSA